MGPTFALIATSAHRRRPEWLPDGIPRPRCRCPMWPCRAAPPRPGRAEPHKAHRRSHLRLVPVVACPRSVLHRVAVMRRHSLAPALSRRRPLLRPGFRVLRSPTPRPLRLARLPSRTLRLTAVRPFLRPPRPRAPVLLPTSCHPRMNRRLPQAMRLLTIATAKRPLRPMPLPALLPHPRADSPK